MKVLNGYATTLDKKAIQAILSANETEASTPRKKYKLIQYLGMGVYTFEITERYRKWAGDDVKAHKDYVSIKVNTEVIA